jgi:hypothetical protein
MPPRRPIKSDQIPDWILDQIRDDRIPDWVLDQIRDPEFGLALLAKHPPEQEQDRQFWQLQFTYMRDWQAGDTLALGHALVDCKLFNKPLPFWLLKAHSELYVRGMSAAEKRSRGDMVTHFLRWKAVKLVRGRHPNDPRNFEKGVRGDSVWEEAAKLLTDTDPGVDAFTVRKSYTLIERAGGASVTLSSYRREVKKRDQGRKTRRKKF